MYGRWEDDVIWDAENMTHIPKPTILTLDPNDENIILGVPDDIDPSKQIAGEIESEKSNVLIIVIVFFFVRPNNSCESENTAPAC